MMVRSLLLLTLLLACAESRAEAGDPLVLELEMDSALLSMAHHIDDFLFERTVSTEPGRPEDLHLRFERPELRDHLVASALVRLDGDVVGMATEQEYVYRDPDTGMPRARSAWLIMLTRPDLQGFLAVDQIEDASAVFSRARDAAGTPEGSWSDEFEVFRSTDGDARVALATDRLARYRGGVSSSTTSSTRPT